MTADMDGEAGVRNAQGGADAKASERERECVRLLDTHRPYRTQKYPNRIGLATKTSPNSGLHFI